MATRWFIHGCFVKPSIMWEQSQYTCTQISTCEMNPARPKTRLWCFSRSLLFLVSQAPRITTELARASWGRCSLSQLVACFLRSLASPLLCSVMWCSHFEPQSLPCTVDMGVHWWAVLPGVLSSFERPCGRQYTDPNTKCGTNVDQLHKSDRDPVILLQLLQYQ